MNERAIILPEYHFAKCEASGAFSVVLVVYRKGERSDFRLKVYRFSGDCRDQRSTMAYWNCEKQAVQGRYSDVFLWIRRNVQAESKMYVSQAAQRSENYATLKNVTRNAVEFPDLSVLLHHSDEQFYYETTKTEDTGNQSIASGTKNLNARTINRF